MENAKRDDNRITTMLGVTDDLAQEVRNLLIDPATGALLVKDVAGDSLIFQNGLTETAGVVELGGTLIKDTLVDINGNNLEMGGIIGATTRELNIGIGAGLFGGAVDGFGVGNTYNDGTDDYNIISGLGDLTALTGSPAGHLSAIFSPTSPRVLFLGSRIDDGNGNGIPVLEMNITNDAENIFVNQSMRSSSGGGGAYDAIVSNNANLFSKIRAREDSVFLEYEDDNGTDEYFGRVESKRNTTKIQSTTKLGANPLVTSEVVTDTTLGNTRMGYNDGVLSSTLTLRSNSLEAKIENHIQHTTRDADGFVSGNRIQKKQGGTVEIAQYLDLPVGVNNVAGNLHVLSGTGVSMEGISTENWQNGAELILSIPAGNTLVDKNTAVTAPGYAAMYLKNSLDIVTTEPTIITFHFIDGNWWQTSEIGVQENNYRSVSASTTVLNSDFTVDQTTSATTVTLLDATTTAKPNQIFNIANSSGGNITVDTTLSQTIYMPGGAVTSVVLLDGELLTVQSTGTDWRSI